MQTNTAFICKNPIVNTLRSQLNWSQYRMLIQIPDHDKREYYELEAVNNAWTGVFKKKWHIGTNDIAWKQYNNSCERVSTLFADRGTVDKWDRWSEK